MNWWLLAGSAMALLCAAGHALAGRGLFYRPIRSAIANDFHAGVFTGLWHLITINFTLSAVALFVLGTYRRGMQRPGSLLRNLPATPQPTSSYRCDLAARGSSSNGSPLPRLQFWSQEAFGRGNEEYRSARPWVHHGNTQARFLFIRSRRTGIAPFVQLDGKIGRHDR